MERRKTSDLDNIKKKKRKIITDDIADTVDCANTVCTTDTADTAGNAETEDTADIIDISNTAEITDQFVKSIFSLSNSQFHGIIFGNKFANICIPLNCQQNFVNNKFYFRHEVLFDITITSMIESNRDRVNIYFKKGVSTEGWTVLPLVSVESDLLAICTC